jgi:hypothetical protein
MRYYITDLLARVLLGQDWKTERMLFQVKNGDPYEGIGL